MSETDQFMLETQARDLEEFGASGVNQIWGGGENAISSFLDAQDAGVAYKPLFDGNAFGSILSMDTSINPYQAQDDAMFADAPEKSGLDKALAWIEKNPTLAKFGLTAGAGLLTSMSQRQMLDEQRDWAEKQKKEEWNRKMRANSYARPEAQMTGVLDRAIAQRGAK